MSELEEIENDIINITNKLIELGRINNRQSQLIDKCLEVIEGRWTDFHVREFLNSDEIKKYKELMK